MEISTVVPFQAGGLDEKNCYWWGLFTFTKSLNAPAPTPPPSPRDPLLFCTLFGNSCQDGNIWSHSQQSPLLSFLWGSTIVFLEMPQTDTKDVNSVSRASNCKFVRVAHILKRSWEGSHTHTCMDTHTWAQWVQIGNKEVRMTRYLTPVINQISAVLVYFTIHIKSYISLKLKVSWYILLSLTLSIIYQSGIFALSSWIKNTLLSHLNDNSLNVAVSF